MGGMRRSHVLSSTSIVHATPCHFPIWLDAEISEVAGALAMGTDDFPAGTSLCSQGSGRSLKSLFFMIVNEIFFMLDGPNDGV